MNRFESVTDGTASHSTWLPNDGNQVAGYKPLRWLMALLLVAFVAGCGNGGGGRDPILGGADVGKATAPSLISAFPVNGAVAVPTNTVSTATFNKAMSPATVVTSFTVTCSLPCVSPVAGTVTYINNTATFTPTGNSGKFLPSTLYTSTITTGAKDLAGNALVSGSIPNPWSWTTGLGPTFAAPTVILTNPFDGASSVPVTKTISATFNEPMSQSTMIPANFTVHETLTPLNVVAGTVSYDVLNNIATFLPTASLTLNTEYTATVTSGAKDLAGNALVVPAVSGLPKPNPWTFTTAAALPAIPIGILSPFGMASFSPITDTGATKVNGDVVINTGLTCSGTGGFIAVGTTNDFGPSCNAGANTITNNAGDTVITQIWNGTAADGTLANAVMVKLTAVWNSISPAIMAGGTPLGCGIIGSTGDAGALLGCAGNPVLPPGTYISATNSSIGISGDLTLDGGGDQNALFVFQAPSSTVITADGAISPGAHTRILLINGAKASNVWWYVGSSATLGTYTEFQGNILASASITMKTGATSCGRLLSGAAGGGAFVFDTNVVSVPGDPFAPPTAVGNVPTICQ
jgi:Ice-binding-like/Bacterial Ig-like domain